MPANPIVEYPLSGAGSMTLIQKQTVSSNVAAVTFSSIPQTYKHLKMVWGGSTVGNAGDAQVQWNGNTTNYNITSFQLTVGAGSSLNNVFGAPAVTVGGTMGEALFPNYTAGGSVTGNGNTNGGSTFYGAGYDGAGTGAVTTISLTINSGANWSSGVFSLYGLS